MSSGLGIGEYDWSTFDRVNDIPLMVASRALELTGRFLADASAVADYVAEADMHRYDDKAAELELVSLVFNHGTSKIITMLSDSDGLVELTAKRGGREYTVRAEAMFDGPVASPVIEFARRGRGKKFECQMEADKNHRSQDVTMCWDIAQVATAATTDLRFRLLNGAWPASYNG